MKKKQRFDKFTLLLFKKVLDFSQFSSRFINGGAQVRPS